jgi:tripartite-type tricarboxylate transporter receptor subunit TctC
MSAVELMNGLTYDVSYTAHQHEVHEYTVDQVHLMPSVVQCFEMIAAAGDLEGEEFNALVDDLIAHSTVVNSPDMLTRMIIIWEGEE